jgi:hypothetical protein
MADVFATINVPTPGNYLLTLGSDDGAYAYVGGSLVLDDGGIHGLQTVSTTMTFLAPGPQSLELQYGNAYCCGAVLEFSVAAVPEPSSWAMMILGFAGVGFMAYRRKAKLVPGITSH